MEAGHAAQNVCLQATALDLGTVVVGAFDDASVKRTLNLRTDEEPLYLLPVGPLCRPAVVVVADAARSGLASEGFFRIRWA